MRYGIFSDVHSNLEALEAVIKAFQEEKIETYFCVGDIVGYGANPQECIALTKELRVQAVAGNHDWAAVKKIATRNFNRSAQEAIAWTQRHLRNTDVDFLENLPLVIKNDYFILVHGTLVAPENFDYLIYPNQLKDMFEAMDRSVCFIGHTHVPFIVFEKDSVMTGWQSWDIKVNPKWKYVVNVGSVGQPRDGIALAAYCIYDTQTQQIHIRRVNYNIEKAQQKIIQAGLPRILAERLSIGQ